MVDVAAPRAVVLHPGAGALLTRVVAATLLVIMPVRLEVLPGLSVGAIAGAALAPVWLGVLARTRRAGLLLVAAVAAVPAGYWLAALAHTDHATSNSLTLALPARLLTIVIGVGVVAWARTTMSTPAVASLFALGLLTEISSSNRLAENAWRFGFAMPATILLLAAAWRMRRRWLEVAAALALAGVSAATGSRSPFGMLLLTGVIVTAVALPPPRSRAASRIRTVFLAVGLVFSLYQVGQSLLLDGLLGPDAQARTEQQVETSGTVLLGGRPELGATAALATERWYGYGAGTLPSSHDILVAKTGMASLGYAADNGYVDNYMFGTQYELHSVLADLWVAFGGAGVLFVFAIGRIAVRAVVDSVVERRAHALTTFLAADLMWNLGFSPLYSSLASLMLAVGLMLPVTRHVDSAAESRF